MIDYAKLHEYASAVGIDYNNLCATVRAALSPPAEGAKGELDYAQLSRRFIEELTKRGKCVVAIADLERIQQERDAARSRLAELLAALERAAHAMWNSEANMDNEAAAAEEAIGNAKSGAPVAQAGKVPEGCVPVPIDRLKAVHRDLDACQKVIWLGMRGADPAYCADAQARLKEIEEWIADAPQPAGGADHE